MTDEKQGRKMSSAAEIYQKLLPSLQWSEQKELSTRCPLHDDENPSLSINTTSGQWFCHVCNEGGAPVNLFMKIKDVDFKTAQRVLGLKTSSDKKKIVATYDYVDELGRLLYQIVRFDPKTFRQRRPDGNGLWIWKIEGVRHVPKNLPAVLDAETVSIVEGERDCETLEWMGLTATTNSGGAGKWRPEYGEYFRGKNVVILPDNDDPGRKHSRDIAKNLYGIAKSMKVVELPGLPEKGDVSDWVEVEGNNNEKLLGIVNLTQEYVPLESKPLHPSDNRELSENLTDLGNARRLVRQHKDVIRYVPQWGWICWNGKFWEHDVSGAITRKAKETIMSIYAEVMRADDIEVRMALAKHAMRSEAQVAIGHTIELAKTEIEVIATPGNFDTDPFLLNCLNGTVNLRTGQLKTHDRKDMITKIAAVTYDPDATCPLFEKFLMRIMNNNISLIRFLQRIIGYSLTGDTSEQCLFILYGSGANGKSTLLTVIQHLLGDYAKQCPSDTFLAKQNQGIPNDVAMLAGARLVSVMETDRGRRLAEGLIKSITGNDVIVARFLHKEFFEFRPSFKLWLSSNYKPGIRGTDYAIWRRVKLIPFNVTILPDEQDKKLDQKLISELPGILSWSIQGCIEWQQYGIATPDEVGAATAHYKAEMADNIFQFIENRCTKDPHGRVQAKTLFENYLWWCTDNGDEGVSQKIFKHRLHDMGYQQRRTGQNGCYEWHGITLTEGTEETEHENTLFSIYSSHEKEHEKGFSKGQNVTCMLPLPSTG